MPRASGLIGIQMFLMPRRLKIVVRVAELARLNTLIVSALGRGNSGPCMGAFSLTSVIRPSSDPGRARVDRLTGCLQMSSYHRAGAVRSDRAIASPRSAARRIRPHACRQGIGAAATNPRVRARTAAPFGREIEMRVETVRAIPLLATLDTPQRTGVATYTKLGVTLVEIRTDTGLVGYGECVGRYAPRIWAAIVDDLLAAARGRTRTPSTPSGCGRTCSGIFGPSAATAAACWSRRSPASTSRSGT